MKRLMVWSEVGGLEDGLGCLVGLIGWFVVVCKDNWLGNIQVKVRHFFAWEGLVAVLLFFFVVCALFVWFSFLRFFSC